MGRTKEGDRIQKTVDRIRSDGQWTTDNWQLTTCDMQPATTNSQETIFS